MNKTVRPGMDVGVAFTSSARRMAAAPGSPSEQAAAIERSSGSFSLKNRITTKIKSLLRPVVRAVYRSVKPFLRPGAERVRAYFLAGLQQGHPQNLSSILSTLKEIKTELHDQTKLRQLEIARLDRIEQYAFASARRFAINCGPGEILLRSEVGDILCSSSDYAVLGVLLEAGELERGTRLLIQRFLKPNDVFIDVGANLGLHTLAAARAMQGRGRIIAFEPFEPTQRLLEKSIWMNGFTKITEIHRAAVSNHSGNHTLFLGATSGHHSLFPLGTPSTLAPQPVEVAVVRLDDVVSDSTKVDLIKIDVEGAELDVLESARPIIANNPSIALIVEFGFSHLARSGQSTKDWLEAFKSLGLVYLAINTDTGDLEEWALEALESVESVNLFFARPESVAWTKARAST